jgi:predicted membrane protein
MTIKLILLLVATFLIIFYVPWLKLSIGLVLIITGFYFWNKKGSKNADK